MNLTRLINSFFDKPTTVVPPKPVEHVNKYRVVKSDEGLFGVQMLWLDGTWSSVMATFDMEKDAKDTIDVLESYDAKRKRDAEKTWTPI